MQLLVTSESRRVVVIIQGSATIAELKEKVEKQSNIK